jgi:hypothetical protein
MLTVTEVGIALRCSRAVIILYTVAITADIHAMCGAAICGAAVGTAGFAREDAFRRGHNGGGEESGHEKKRVEDFGKHFDDSGWVLLVMWYVW